MRGRKKEPEGRRVQVCFKISQPEADLIDSLRGGLERGPWMRQAALSVARRDSGKPRPVTVAGIEIPLIADDRQVPGTVTVVSAWREDDELKVSAASVVNIATDNPSPRPRNCKHPKVHVKGVCPDCKTYVAKK